MTKDEQARRAWREADTVPGRSPECWRRDFRGRLMRRGSFGTRGRYAWVLGRPRAAAAPAGVRADARQLQAVHESTFHHDCCGTGPAPSGRHARSIAQAGPSWPRPVHAFVVGREEALHGAGERRPELEMDKSFAR